MKIKCLTEASKVKCQILNLIQGVISCLLPPAACCDFSSFKVQNWLEWKSRFFLWPCHEIRLVYFFIRYTFAIMSFVIVSNWNNLLKTYFVNILPLIFESEKSNKNTWQTKLWLSTTNHISFLLNHVIERTNSNSNFAFFTVELRKLLKTMLLKTQMLLYFHKILGSWHYLPQSVSSSPAGQSTFPSHTWRISTHDITYHIQSHHLPLDNLLCRHTPGGFLHMTAMKRQLLRHTSKNQDKISPLKEKHMKGYKNASHWSQNNVYILKYEGKQSLTEASWV